MEGNMVREDNSSSFLEISKKFNNLLVEFLGVPATIWWLAWPVPGATVIANEIDDYEVDVHWYISLGLTSSAFLFALYTKFLANPDSNCQKISKFITGVPGAAAGWWVFVFSMINAGCDVFEAGESYDVFAHWCVAILSSSIIAANALHENYFNEYNSTHWFYKLKSGLNEVCAKVFGIGGILWVFSYDLYYGNLSNDINGDGENYNKVLHWFLGIGLSLLAASDAAYLLQQENSTSAMHSLQSP
jgi:hypothetical protein